MEKQWAFALRLLLLLLSLAFTVWLIGSLTWVIGLLLVSALIVYVLTPAMEYLKNKFKVSHALATALVFCGFLLFCIFSISLIIPIVYFEVTELIENLPQYMVRFQEYLSWFSQQTINLNLEAEFRGYLLSLTDNLYLALEYLADASMSVIGGAVDFVLVLVLVGFLLYDFQGIRCQFIGLIPLAKRALAEELLDIVDANVGTFVRGSLIRCFIVGLITGIALFAIGMPYALLLSIIAGVLNFILYIGPNIAAVPALILSFSPQTPSPLLVLALYITIQLIDGFYLAPVVLGRIVKLRPITVIVSILAGGQLAGLLGMVLAVPVAGMLKSIVTLIQKGPAYRPPEEATLSRD